LGSQVLVYSHSPPAVTITDSTQDSFGAFSYLAINGSI
jgi:hypothetical protein